MTQHEYIFIAISVVLGLAMARLLHNAALLVRSHTRVSHHWATTLWGSCIFIYILQLWWVGWELRLVTDWSIFDFFALVIGAIFVYGAAEMALPVEDYDIADDTELNFLAHSRTLGRVSAMSMFGYFAVGPYVNLTMFNNPPLPSYGFPILGGTLMLLMMLKPRWFEWLSIVFTVYTVLILYLTA
ncbi:MAG: hypothetical protein HKN35_05980 [Woeseia sp.]|nr:hypothetical protein [Woeseia sp.]NNE60419.1 hypothetical protein [Woeseia sp.]